MVHLLTMIKHCTTTNVINAHPTLNVPTISVRKTEVRVDIIRWLMYRFGVKVKNRDRTTYGCIAGIFVIQTL